MNQHFSRLLEQPFRYPINQPLVAQARQALQKTPLASLVYRALGEQARSLAPYRLDEHLGPQGAVFSGSQAVIPGLYTKQGYQQFFLTRGVGLAHDLLRDNWIMGQSNSLDPIHVRKLMKEVEQLYFRDYADQWQQALAKVELQPLDSLAQSADHASALVAANSPLLQLLIQVRDNTRFPTLGESAADLAEETTPPAARNATAALTEKSPGDARSALQRRFEPLHRLLDEHNGASSELTPTLSALTDLHQQLANLSQDSQPDQAAFEFAKARIQGKRSALDTLRNTASRLPPPLVGWLRALGDDSWQWVLEDTYHYLNQRYQGELYSAYTAALHQRYPFHANSTSEVALADFREFFRAQGTADSFFESYLKPFVSFDGAQYRLRSVEGRSLPMSRGVLQQMGNVQQIRRGFFAENAAEPLIKFSLEPYSLDSSLSRADFRLGDQYLEYRHGPIVATAFQWPTTTDEGFSSLIVEELDGRRLVLQKNTGQWSLFRLFDLMQKAPHRGRDVLMLKADVGGLRANYLLLSQRSPNPFDLTAVRNFRLPAAL